MIARLGNPKSNGTVDSAALPATPNRPFGRLSTCEASDRKRQAKI
jgi:protein-S-isoprenylcysteine O-methyltransferase Ste14